MDGGIGEAANAGRPFAFGNASTATYRRLVIGNETPVDTSSAVEVFIHAFDRVGCKIEEASNAA
jgi:hypothetical protein